MSAARGVTPWKLTLGGFVVASLAAAFGANVVGLAGAIAVPALGIAGLGLLLGIDELWNSAARLAFAAIGIGIAAQSVGRALHLLMVSPWFWAVLLLGLIAFLSVAAVRLLGAMATVKLPERQRVGKTPIRERVDVVRAVEGTPFTRPPAPDSDDELGAWRRRQ